MIKEKTRQEMQVKWIIFTGIFMLSGLILLKYIPMFLFGKDIMFDASAHVVFASFILYLFWFFVDQNRNIKIPYLVFSFAILTIISIQRIIRGKHNEIGLILGFLVVVISIVAPRWKYIKNNLEF